MAAIISTRFEPFKDMNDDLKMNIFSFLSEELKPIHLVSRDFNKNAKLYKNERITQFFITNLSRKEWEKTFNLVKNRNGRWETISLFSGRNNLVTLTPHYSSQFINDSVQFINLKKLKLRYSSTMRLDKVSKKFPSLQKLVLYQPTLAACVIFLRNLPTLRRLTIIDCVENFNGSILENALKSSSDSPPVRVPPTIHLIYKNSVAKVVSLDSINPYLTSYTISGNNQDLGLLRGSEIKKLQISESFSEPESSESAVSLDSFKSLTALNLNDMKTVDVESLSLKVSKLINLRRLSLSFNIKTDERDATKSVVSYKERDIIPPATILQFIRQPSLSFLNLNLQKIKITKELFEEITKLHLRTLVLNCASLNVKLLPLLSELGNSSTIQHLELHQIYRPFNQRELLDTHALMFDGFFQNPVFKGQILIVEPNLSSCPKETQVTSISIWAKNFREIFSPLQQRLKLVSRVNRIF